MDAPDPKIALAVGQWVYSRIDELLEREIEPDEAEELLFLSSIIAEVEADAMRLKTTNDPDEHN